MAPSPSKQRNANDRRVGIISRSQLALTTVALMISVALACEFAYRRLVAEDDAYRSAAAFTARSLRLLEPCARIESRGGALHVVADAADDLRLFDVPLARTPGIVRIAVVGESTASMVAVAMQRILADSPTPLPVEILNCSSPGAALEHAQRRADEVFRYQPDVLVVIFGHNIEMQYPMDAWRLRLTSLRDHSRLLSAVALAGSAPVPPRHTALEPRIERLAQWLDALAERATARDVVLVPATLAVNLWVPPYAERGDLWHHDFLVARFEYARGERAAAIRHLRELTGDAGPAYWHFTLGTWLAKSPRSDDRAQAHRQLQLAVDRVDTEPDRAPSAINRAIRTVADKHDLSLRDTESTVATIAYDGIPGWDVMSDHCHLQPWLVRREAAELIAVALQRLDPPVAVDSNALARWPDPAPFPRMLEGLTAAQAYVSGGFAERWQAATGEAAAQWLRDSPVETRAAIDDYLAGPVFASVTQPARRAALLTALACGYRDVGDEQRAAELLTRAESEGSAAAAVERGLFELGRGEGQAASNAWQRALVLDPEREDAHEFLALLEDAERDRTSEGSR